MPVDVFAEGRRDPIQPLFHDAGGSYGDVSDAEVFAHRAGYEIDTGTLTFTLTADDVAGQQGLVSKDATQFGTGGHLTVWLDDGRIVARLQSGNRSYELSGGTVAAGEAQAVAVSFGQGGFKLYVDGVIVDSTNYSGGLAGNREPLVLGASQWTSSNTEADVLSQTFRGTLSDVALYDGTLTGASIEALAAGAQGGSASGPAPAPAPQPEPAAEAGTSTGVWLAFDGNLDAAAGDASAGLADSKAREAYVWNGDDGAYHLTGGNSIQFERSAETFYDREDFHISLSLQKTAAGGEGAFLHLHGTLEAKVDAAGRLIFTLSTSKGNYEVKSAAGVLDDTAAHQIDIRFGDGSLELLVDGAVVAETAAEGVTAPVKYWGFHVGHNWNESLDAYVDDFIFDDLGTGGSSPQPNPQPNPQPSSEVPVGAGLVAAFSTDEGVSVGAGGLVTGWSDGSGRGNDLGAKGDPRLLSGATPTGEAAVAFDGKGDLLERVGDLDGFVSGGGDRTMFLVVRYGDAEGVTSGLVYGDGAQNEAFGLVARNDGDLTLQGWGGANDFDSDVDGVGAGWMVQSVVLDDGLFRHYRDGALIDEAQHAFATDLKKLVLGGEIAGLGESQLDIASALVYDRALGAAERQQVEAFLQDKYIGEGGQPEPQPEPKNSAPAATGSIGTISLDEGGRKTVDLSKVFADADGDALSYQLTGAPNFVTLSGKTLTVAPKDGDDGSFGFGVKASDGEDTSPAMSVTVKVADAIGGGGGGGGGGGIPSDPITLKAAPGILKSGKIGAQEWGDGVVLKAFDLSGKAAEVAYSEQFQDHGFGVKGPGSRWDGQIDYYEWGSAGPRSEKLVIDFNGDVTDVTLRVGMLGYDEGRNGMHETGTWTAYDDGKVVGSGLIGPELSSLGSGRKESGSYGIYPIEVDPGTDFDELVIKATQFGHGEGRSQDMSYGENSSDINVMGIEFLRMGDVDDFLL